MSLRARWKHSRVTSRGSRRGRRRTRRRRPRTSRTRERRSRRRRPRGPRQRPIRKKSRSDFPPLLIMLLVMLICPSKGDAQGDADFPPRRQQGPRRGHEGGGNRVKGGRSRHFDPSSSQGGEKDARPSPLGQSPRRAQASLSHQGRPRPRRQPRRTGGRRRGRG